MATADDFKNVMSRWVTGISVITTRYNDELRGFTANSFASVSIDPLLISMSVAKTLHTLEYIQNSGFFAVNILKREHIDWGKRFAGMIPEYNDDRFQDLDITFSRTGAPLLPDTLGWMDCTVYKTVDVGASILFLGEVVEAGWVDELEPLAYFHRQWGTFTALNN